jgi:hypothetical protein
MNIGVGAMTKLYFSVHKTFFCELMIYHTTITCMNPVCYTPYTLIFTLCICKLCHTLKMNLFIANVLSTVLRWIQKKLPVFDQYVVTNTAHNK